MALTAIQKALLDKLEAERKTLGARLTEVETEIEDLRQEASPFKVGDVVTAYRRRTRQHEDAEISDVQYMGWGDERYWYRVNWRKSNGQFGRQNERVFSDLKAKS